MSNPDWLKAIENSPVAHLNKKLVQGCDATAKSSAARKSSKGKSKYLGEMHLQLFAWCKENNLLLVTELKFHAFRKYRFDFSIFRGITEEQARALEFTSENIIAAVEYEGGVLIDRSGHKSVRNYQKDVEKYNLAQSLGWPVLRFTVLNYKTVIQELEKFNE